MTVLTHVCAFGLGVVVTIGVIMGLILREDWARFPSSDASDLDE